MKNNNSVLVLIMIILTVCFLNSCSPKSNLPPPKPDTIEQKVNKVDVIQKEFDKNSGNDSVTSIKKTSQEANKNAEDTNKVMNEIKN